MVQLLARPKQFAVLHLCALEGMGELQGTPSIQAEVATSPDLILAEFEDVFDEPQQLPPQRDHNHRIKVKEGSQPVNIQPYRHSSA